MTHDRKPLFQAFKMPLTSLSHFGIRRAVRQQARVPVSGWYFLGMVTHLSLSRSLSDPRVSNRSHDYAADFQMLHPRLKRVQWMKRYSSSSRDKKSAGETMETSFSGIKETNGRKSRRQACIIWSVPPVLFDECLCFCHSLSVFCLSAGAYPPPNFLFSRSRRFDFVLSWSCHGGRSVW